MTNTIIFHQNADGDRFADALGVTDAFLVRKEGKDCWRVYVRTGPNYKLGFVPPLPRLTDARILIQDYCDGDFDFGVIPYD